MTAPFFVDSSSLDEAAAAGASRFRRQVNAAVMHGKLTSLSVQMCRHGGIRYPRAGVLFISILTAGLQWQHSFRQSIPSFSTESQIPLTSPSGGDQLANSSPDVGSYGPSFTSRKIESSIIGIHECQTLGGNSKPIFSESDPSDILSVTRALSSKTIKSNLPRTTKASSDFD